MSDNIIEVTGVSKSYGGVLANKDISIRVPKGKITGLKCHVTADHGGFGPTRRRPSVRGRDRSQPVASGMTG